MRAVVDRRAGVGLVPNATDRAVPFVNVERNAKAFKRSRQRKPGRPCAYHACFMLTVTMHHPGCTDLVMVLARTLLCSGEFQSSPPRQIALVLWWAGRGGAAATGSGPSTLRVPAPSAR